MEVLRKILSNLSWAIGKPEDGEETEGLREPTLKALLQRRQKANSTGETEEQGSNKERHPLGKPPEEFLPADVRQGLSKNEETGRRSGGREGGDSPERIAEQKGRAEDEEMPTPDGDNRSDNQAGSLRETRPSESPANDNLEKDTGEESASERPSGASANGTLEGEGKKSDLKAKTLEELLQAHFPQLLEVSPKKATKVIRKKRKEVRSAILQDPSRLAALTNECMRSPT